jgi:IS5 family transposase
VDGYVIETNIHFPTDIKLLEDSGRKALDMVRKAYQLAGQPVPGWRKVTHWSKRLRNQQRTLSRISSRGGRNREQRVTAATEVYLQIAKKINQKLESAHLFINTYSSVKMEAISVALSEYQKYLNTHIDLVRRRLLEGETIPHSEKIFSIFEPHTEWISKGKAHKKVELGLNTIIATDQWHFILYHKILESEAEVATAVPTAKKICKKYKVDKLDSISFDKGFYSGPNYKNLQDYALQVILPKKGKRTEAEEIRERESSFVKLRHKHSGVEANINQLEHHGLNKCPDKGLAHFKRYVALGVLAYNIHRIGNILLERERKKLKKAQATKRAA